MAAIYKKELRVLFQNVTGFLFMGAVLAVFGLFFFYYNISVGYPSIAVPLSNIRFFLVIMTPILCMRLLSEEKKNKTDQLLFTSPVSATKIVFAKYFAAATVYSAAMLIIAIAPLFLSIFGDVSFAENYTGFFGFYLYGLSFIAIALFASSLTESQMISAILGVVFLFIGFMMSAITSVISQSENILTKILNCYNLNTPLDDFLSGSLSLTGVVYYITIILAFLFLTIRIMTRKRITLQYRYLWSGLFSISLTVLILVSLVAGNILLSYLPEKYKNIDVTEKKMYSLTDTTKDFLKTVDQDVTISVFGEEKDIDDLLNKTLKRYADENDHIKIKYMDPNEYPSLGTGDGQNTLSTGSLIVSANGKTKEIASSDIYQTDIDYYSYTQSVTGYDGEGRITSAIAYVLSGEELKIYITEGHNERRFSANYQYTLQKANIDYEYVNLIDMDSIPDDVSAVIINGPMSDFSKDDIDKLKEFINSDGKLMVNADCVSTEKLNNLNGFLEEYGIKIIPGIVKETDSTMYYPAGDFYLLPEVQPATENSYLASYVFVPDSSGFKTEESDDNYITSLLKTSDGAYSVKIQEAEEGSDQMMATDEKIEDGPFDIGLSVGVGSETPDIYVFGSFEMFTDAADQVVSNTNRQLFANILSEMTSDDAAEQGQNINVDVKQYSASNLTFTAGAVILYGIIWGIIVPVLLIVVGIAIFAYRRLKK